MNVTWTFDKDSTLASWQIAQGNDLVILTSREARALRDALLLEYPVSHPEWLKTLHAATRPTGSPEPYPPAIPATPLCAQSWIGTTASNHRCVLRIVDGQPHETAHVCSCGAVKPREVDSVTP